MTTTETQDIVERLRHSANVLGNYDSEWTPDVATMRAAAAEIERLRSLTEWRPIETAPRDGTDILIFEGNAIIAAWWTSANPRLSGWDAGEFMCDHPTHWLPLPPPPGDTP